jgi:hypothetical protein
MSFEGATAKLKIDSLDEPRKYTVTAQYNPKELQVDKSIPWSKVNQANQSNSQGIHLEFTGAEGRSMSVELLFDGYETKGSVGTGANATTVVKMITNLESLASVRKPASKNEDERRPHLCIVSWGQNGLPSFTCVIESLSTKYTMMDTNGVPLRATCTVKLKEADVVSAAKAQGQAAPGGGAPSGPAPGTPPSGGTPPGGGG